MSKNPTNLDSPEPAKKPRKRRWLQFSLRSLIIVVTLSAIPCAWFGRKIEQKRKERDAVAAIVKLGGEVLYDYQIENTKPPGPDWLREMLGEDFFSEVDAVRFYGDVSDLTMTDAGLLNLEWLPQLRRLELMVDNDKITDAGLVNLKWLPQLRSLNLTTPSITDAGLVNLKGLAQLQRLSLQGFMITDGGLVNLKELNLLSLNLVCDKVTDAGLAHLKGLQQLETLGLVGTRVSDTGLIKLTEFNRLQSLSLWMTKFTDAGLANLKDATQIRTLILGDTHVTAAGVKDLQKALPNCRIQR